MAVELTKELVRSFVEIFLQFSYDKPMPIPDFHDEIWGLCCSDDKYVSIAAPRGHAKSTSVTDAYALCGALFRTHRNILLLSDSEGQASMFLSNIKNHLTENADLRKHFMISGFGKETETELEVKFSDGYMCRFLAKGAQQKMRGSTWLGMRPDLVVGDDLESDESVMNKDRREKFSNWFMRTLIPIGNDDCKFRIVGTILHLDSMLNNLINNVEWSSLLFRACDDDFTNLLWPEKFTVERLKKIYALYMSDNDPGGWSQEYLNNPVPEGETYFRTQDFIPMSDQDRDSHKVYFAAADFSISEKERADYTVMVVVGMDSERFLHVVDVRRMRAGSKEIIRNLISIQRRYSPEVFTFETEKIDKAIGPFLSDEMRRTGQYLNINLITPTKSKTTRGKSIQGMMEAGACRFDDRADWYDLFFSELMTVTPDGPKGAHDDQFDAFAYIGLTLDRFYEGYTPEEIEELEYEDEFEEYESTADFVTGY